MRAVCLVDTSVFCELVGVPYMCDDQGALVAELERKLESDEALLLPMATILETGNHIGQNGDGRLRFQTARRFAHQVQLALTGASPFTATPMLEPELLREWLLEFPDWAKRSDGRGKGSGLGDLTIYAEWERQRDRNPGRRVYVWSKDLHLASLDSG